MSLLRNCFSNLIWFLILHFPDLILSIWMLLVLSYIVYLVLRIFNYYCLLNYCFPNVIYFSNKEYLNFWFSYCFYLFVNFLKKSVKFVLIVLLFIIAIFYYYKWQLNFLYLDSLIKLINLGLFLHSIALLLS